MPAAPNTHGNSTHIAYRPDIDGLRAVAVLSVLVFHAFPSVLPGGFIGVDIFFVISGFLISGIISRSLQQGSFSFADFYGRRIRRIFPALAVVLTTSLGLGAMLLTLEDFQMLARHTTAGAAFFSNIKLLKESGYFDTSAELKPLLHLWSLAIEEQFYIFWPLLMLACWKLRVKAGWLAAVTAVGSFAFCLFMLAKDPTKAFYLPVTRIWELAMGVMLAVSAAPRPQPAKAIARQVVAILGIGFIVTGLLLIDNTKAFPGWWALLPTVGSLCLIWSGPGAAINRLILSNRVLVAVGLVSFPLYLWHWPLLVFLRYYEGGLPDWRLRLLALLAAFVLAVATYFVIERPLRFGGNRKLKTVGLLLAMVLIALTGLVIGKSDRLQRFYTASPFEEKFRSVRDHHGICAMPGFDEALCNTTTDEIPETVLMGDSHAERLYWGMRPLYEAAGKSFALFGGNGGCPPYLGLDTRNVRKGNHNCEIKSGVALRYVLNEPQIKTVFLNSRGPFYTEPQNLLNDPGDIWTLARNGQAAAAGDNLKTMLAAMDATFAALRAAHKQVVFVYDVPELRFDAKSCLPSQPWQIRRKTRTDCVERYSDFKQRTDTYRHAVDKLLAAYPEIRVVDLAEALCDANECRVLKDGQSLYGDDNHLNARGAAYVSEALKDQLLTK